MIRHAFHCLVAVLFMTPLAVSAADNPAALPDAAQTLALTADAIVVARVGTVSNSQGKSYAALWIEQALKGRLRGGRDIIWVARDNWPKFEPEPKYLLLFLSRDGAGFYHLKRSETAAGVFALNDLKAPLIADTAKIAGAFGPSSAETPSDDEIDLWIKKAAKGSRRTREEAFSKLLAAGDSARPQLVSSSGHSEREIAAVSRTLLPLTGGGPIVNGLRLLLEPTVLEMKADDTRLVTIHYANLTARDIKVVTGVGSRGDNIQASAAYEVRKIGADRKTLSAPLPTTLPQNYGQSDPKLPPLPLVKNAPAFSTLPLAVELKLVKHTADGKEQLRLHFPHGHIDLPEPGRYSVIVRFECAGPRPDQERLQAANYWHGGQLTSNDLLLEIK